jgi:hypothetical protein
MIRAFFLALTAVLSACAPSAVVMVSHGYNPRAVRSVAVLGITDYDGAPGSGEIAANALDKYLLWADYRVVERRQVQQILQEQSFAAAAADPATIKNVGRLLGVDAVIFGAVTDFSNARDQTVMVDVPQQQTDPVYGKIVTVQHDNGAMVKTVQDVVTGYSTTETDQWVPEVETLPAHVGLSARLVDAGSGELLWDASAQSEGVNPATATEQACSALMQGVVKQIKKASRPAS